MEAVRAILARVDSRPIVDHRPVEELLFDEWDLPK
jgi:hypothetical protein